MSITIQISSSNYSIGTYNVFLIFSLINYFWLTSLNLRLDVLRIYLYRSRTRIILIFSKFHISRRLMTPTRETLIWNVDHIVIVCFTSFPNSIYQY